MLLAAGTRVQSYCSLPRSQKSGGGLGFLPIVAFGRLTSSMPGHVSGPGLSCSNAVHVSGAINSGRCSLGKIHQLRPLAPFLAARIDSLPVPRARLVTDNFFCVGPGDYQPPS